MGVNVKVNGQIISVPNGAAEEAVDYLLKQTMPVDQVRTYLSSQKVKEAASVKQFGYVDFDRLTHDGKPTIVGDFYGEDSPVGRKLTSK
jgi:hypothetical protein